MKTNNHKRQDILELSTLKLSARSQLQSALYLPVIVVLLAITFLSYSTSSQAEPFKASNEKRISTCVYIASYAPGYNWQDGIEKAIRDNLAGKCQLKTFFMNSKKVTNEPQLEEIGLQAARFIKQKNPDVVIVSDDNAAKYVLKEHYRNSPIPFVFCGINNTGELYGLPYKNATGMIEKNPTEALLKLLFNIRPSKTHVAFLTTTGTSAALDVREFHKLVNKLQIRSSSYQIRNQEDWRRIYKQVQEDPQIDIVIFSNRAAFKNWDHQKNLQWVLQHNHKISVTTQDSMLPYVALGMNKSPQEHGQWAALAAIEILNGVAPNKLAVVPNQQFQLWANPQIIKPFRSADMNRIISQSLIYDYKAVQ